MFAKFADRVLVHGGHQQMVHQRAADHVGQRFEIYISYKQTSGLHALQGANESQPSRQVVGFAVDLDQHRVIGDRSDQTRHELAVSGLAMISQASINSLTKSLGGVRSSRSVVYPVAFRKTSIACASNVSRLDQRR